MNQFISLNLSLASSLSLHREFSFSNRMLENLMYLLYFTAFFGVVSGSNRFTSPDLQFINFARPIIGRKLNGSIIKETEVDSESHCQFSCVRESRCLSYNFGPAKDKKTFKCQLSDSDRFVGVKNFTKYGEFLYRGVQVISDPRDKIVIIFAYYNQAYIGVFKQKPK